MYIKAVHRLVQGYLNQGKEIILAWREAVQNPTYDLNERWELFISAPSLWGNSLSSSDHILDSVIGHRSPSNFYYLSRGESMTAEHMIEFIQTKVTDGELPETTVDEAKAHLMEHLIVSWCWDW
jgi:hypothetical protein